MVKLTIVVNCTDRKSQVPTPDLRLRSLPPGDLSTRFASWRRRVEAAPGTTKLIDLYQGEAWQQVRKLAGDASDSGFDVKLLVASAGLGLREVDSYGPAYAATFAGGHADSVGSGQVQLGRWWVRLRTLRGARRLCETADDRVLLVLSETYARAMDEDLAALATLGGDVLLVGGARNIAGMPRLAADRALRRELGGTASSLTIRMARAWLARRSCLPLYSVADERAWTRWAQSAAHVEEYRRSPMTDAQLLGLISKLKASDPTLSATRALRRVRDAGIACEQKRFGELFRDTVGSS
ncbi:hypothetical protein BST16_09145 [Mycobacterium asiaticum DSM 44297]|nr:hypothetical protein BST16_09145 [Mycobacterium asiaticum DSM 44297]